MSEGFLLTDEERLRFIRYLDNFADSTKLIVEQLEKVPGHGFAVIVRHHKAEMMACQVVSKMLKNTESQFIG